MIIQSDKRCCHKDNDESVDRLQLRIADPKDRDDGGHCGHVTRRKRVERSTSMEPIELVEMAAAGRKVVRGPDLRRWAAKNPLQNIFRLFPDQYTDGTHERDLLPFYQMQIRTGRPSENKEHYLRQESYRVRNAGDELQALRTSKADV